MGIEDQPAVEEPTEPPICGSTKAPHQQPPTGAPSAFQPANPGSSRNHSGTSTTSTAITANGKRSAASGSPATGNTAAAEWLDRAHTTPVVDIAALVRTDVKDGLTASEAARRLENDGPNKVEGAKGLSLWKIFMRQISNSLTIVLLIVMVLSWAIDDYIEGGVILAVILLNIVVGFVQDYRAEQTIMSLYALSAPTCKVVRDGQIDNIKAESLVVGDIVSLNVGDIVPADLRLIDGLNLSTDEALLTGESMPISKHPERTMDRADVPLGDRVNMVYSASTITRGRSTGIVVATGMYTEVGKIAEMLRATRGQDDSHSTFKRYLVRAKNAGRSVLGLDGTPLQVKLSKFALLLFGLAILLAIIVFSASKWHIDDEVLIYGICVGVAVIPESLIAVLTITMAVGTKAMAAGNVVVRKLSALEAVGGVTNICSDKTGTLTQGKMIAKRVWLRDGTSAIVNGSTHPFDPSSGNVSWTQNGQTLSTEKTDANVAMLGADAKAFVECVSLCNNSTVTDSKGGDGLSGSTEDLGETSTVTTAVTEWSAVGEPTEIALNVFALRFGYGKQVLVRGEGLHLLAEHPFDSSCKRMSVLYKSPESDKVSIFTKGALEMVMPLLDASDEVKAEFNAQAEALAAEGLRVLLIAYKTISASDAEKCAESREATETGLTPLGLAGLYDPPRIETAEAVQKCKAAGIKVHMLTGDHIKTATAIAREVGIIDDNLSVSESSGAIMAASTFDAMTKEEVDKLEALPLVLARCSPATKVRMVEAMHRRKAFCVMTGDGVNDSPALKKSDVGIAMGLNGSDVAKEAADMVLTDDNFSSIVTAVEEGRRLFDNIQKFILHLLVSNIAQVILLLIGLAFKDNDNNSVFPLSPLEILWVNLITSSFLALGLGLEEAQLDIMVRKPHDLRVGVFTTEIIMDKMAYGFFMGSLCLAAFSSVAYGYQSDPINRLGSGCNSEYNDTCGAVFRARATTYSTLSFLLLVTAWEVKHIRRSLFNMNPEIYSGPFSVFRTIWRNRFLFWAVVAGFVITFPVVYLPTVNHIVFKHSGITWEWGIVVGCVVMYVALIEIWKAGKRRFFFKEEMLATDV